MHLIIAALSILYLAGATCAQTWRNITPEGGPAPSPRVNASAIYDPLAHRMVVFGGRGSSGDLNDLWAFDLSMDTWSQLLPQGDTPAPRAGAAAIYVPSGSRMVLFGGGGDENFNDVWSLDGLGPVPTAVQQEQRTLPWRSALQQNYPNPFNPSTTIQYSLSAPTRVRLIVHDLLGRRIRTLVDQQQMAGLYAVSWDGTGPRDHPAGAGVYLYQLETQDRIQTRKLVLVR